MTDKAAMRLASLILAGGRSRRMHEPKEALRLDGESLLAHVARRLLPGTHPVVVVARGRDQVLPPLPPTVEVVFDATPDGGPLAGIATGMRHLVAGGHADAAFVTGCDAPFVDARAATWLAERLGAHELALPRLDGHVEPLCAVYRLTALAAVERLLAAGIAMPKALVDHLHTRWLDAPELRTFDPELRFLRDVNTPAEWRWARDQLQSPSD
jgi:molybdopterin-guanine dinucleotide biosynthesis protein A